MEIFQRVKNSTATYAAIIAVLLLSAGAGIAHAASSSVTSGAFASYPVSVRGAGMGGVYSSIVENLGGAYHNPARLGFVDTRAGGISYADMSGLGLVRNVYLEYVHRFRFEQQRNNILENICLSTIVSQ